MTVTLERLTHADINLLRELRNANADAFFDDTYITREMQEDWWYRLNQPDNDKAFYTIWLNKVTPVGFLSVRFVDAINTFFSGGWVYEVREIGHLLLAPAFRGRGIMHAALTEVRRLYDPLTFWVAHVKSTNAASLKLFAAQGFVQCERTPKRSARQCRSSSATKPTSTKPSSLGCSATSKAR